MNAIESLLDHLLDIRPGSCNSPASRSSSKMHISPSNFSISATMGIEGVSAIAVGREESVSGDEGSQQSKVMGDDAHAASPRHISIFFL